MTTNELAELFLKETERILCETQSEFIPLNEEQLQHSVHIEQCNIRQIMQRLVTRNARLIASIESALPLAGIAGKQQEYEPGCLAKYIMKRFKFSRCIMNRKSARNHPSRELSGGNIFEVIIHQQYQLKELITLCVQADMNKKVVPFRLFGKLKFSLAETLEYLFLCQRSYFRLARQLLITQ